MGPNLPLGSFKLDHILVIALHMVDLSLVFLARLLAVWELGAMEIIDNLTPFKLGGIGYCLFAGRCLCRVL